jgi:two-component system phosphate regulon sensor histidine kinase PhoR
MREVAHELRAPIAAIRSFLTLILQGYATPEKTKEWQQRAAERADDLLQLIDDVLNLSRLKDPRTESQPELVSVEAVLEDVLGLHAPEAEAKGIWLRVQTQPCGMVVADPAHIKQLWTNLISNAIKYTPRGGQIMIRLFPEHGTVVGVVKDTGIGITQEDLARLFEPFFRTQQAREFSRHGTGLGLSIVRQVIQHYGGTINVESELGKGTQFVFRLPASSKDARTWSAREG